MSSELDPWVVRPFELIFHAEGHYRKGTEYDKRLALISFDNSIEVSITVYLHLRPEQRGGKEYGKIDPHLKNYYTKIDFFINEIASQYPASCRKEYILWYHDRRNECYHGHNDEIPRKDTLDGVRRVALDVFSRLFKPKNLY